MQRRRLGALALGWRARFAVESGLILIAGLISVLWIIAPASGSGQQGSQDILKLEIGKPIERELAGGQSHSYRIALTDGQYLHVVVAQQGIDVVVRVMDSDGKQVVEVDSPNGEQGEEPVYLVAETTRNYQIDVRSLEKEAKPGRYEIKIAEQRSFKTQDYNWIVAQKAYEEGQHLRVQGTAASLKEAIERYQKSLLLWRALGEQTREAFTLNYIGRVYYLLEEYPKSLDYHNQALLVARDVGDRNEEASSLNNIALLYNSLGEKQKALEYYQLALPIRQAVGNRSGRAVILYNLGLFYRALYQNQKALDSDNEALALFRALGDLDGEAATLNNIGEIYSALGEHRKATSYYDKSLQISKSQGDRRGYAASLDNIGKSYLALGEMNLALKCYDEVLRVRRAIGHKRGEAVTISSIGSVYDSLGETAKALDYYSQSLLLFRIANDPGGEATTLHNIGTIFDALGDQQKALDYYQQSLALKKLAGGDLLVESATLYRIARVLRDRGELDESLSRVKSALDRVEFIRANVANQGLRVSYFASVQSYYELQIDLLMRLHQQRQGQGYDAGAIQTSEQARARSLIEMLSEARTDIRQGVAIELVVRERHLQQRINDKAAAAFRLRSNKRSEHQVAALEKEVDLLITELQQVQLEIRQKNPSYADLIQPQPVNVSKIQQEILDRDTLLLEYAFGEKQSYLWAVTSTSLSSYQLPPRAEIEAAARRIYDLLIVRQPKPGLTQAQQQAREAEADANYWPQAAALSQMLLGPVASQLGNKRLLIVAPGALQYVPFAALPTLKDQGGGIKNEKDAQAHVPLVAEHEVVSLPSASALAVLRRETASRQAAPKTVAVIADPVFEPDDPRIKSASANRQARQNDLAARQAAEPQTDSLPTDFERAVRSLKGSGDRAYLARLPHTRKEADAIFALAPAGAGMKSLDFQANRATAAGGDLSQYRIVHYAAHGLLNSEQPELSGLVLSLVDEAGRPQDGFLRLHDIYNLRLNADLVVLSACQTALGKNVKGEGLVGLTRGFMYAGAQRVVASLWQVNDAATAELMKRFYQGMLRDGKRPAAALRDAQIEMWKRKSTQAPYYWAAFILQGEWR